MTSEKLTRALCTHPEYQHRQSATNFDDREMRDLWQDAVYARAREIARVHDYRSVVDYGCGSGYKLMKYFSGMQTIGYELEPCLSYLRDNYPSRVWEHPDHARWIHGDMLICADVIEHVQDPVALLESFKTGPLRTIVLSTPALEILAERGESPRLGPPNNESHLREWTTREFHDFVNMHFDILEHTVINCQQATQMIVASLR